MMDKPAPVVVLKSRSRPCFWATEFASWNSVARPKAWENPNPSIVCSVDLAFTVTVACAATHPARSASKSNL